MRILVARTDRIGDVILATPVLTAIRKKFPDSHIAMLVSNYTKEMIEGNSNVNEIFIYENSIKKLTELLKEKQFDLAIILYPRFKIAFSCLLAGTKKRIGTAYRWYSFLFNEKIHVHRSRVEKHELEYNFDLLKPLGIEFNNEKPTIYLSKQDEKFAEEKLTDLEIKDKFIIIHPGMSGSAENWPIENYAKLGDEIQKQGEEVLVTGGNNDRETINKMLNMMQTKPYVLVGETTIKQLAAIISKCSIFISGSTGPMHIAASLNVPTLSFFPKALVRSSKRWGPYGNKHVVLESVNLAEINVSQSLEKLSSIAG